MTTAVIWGKPACPNCDKAKALLESRGVEVQEKKLGTDFELEDIRALIPNVREVPQVFIDDQLVGGLREVVQYLKNQGE
jgi:glutaredoxin 3